MRNYEDCRTYVDHILVEHRRLHQMLLGARKAIARGSELGADDGAEQFVSALREVRSELRSHFTEEEEGGCLDQVVCFQPNLSPELKQIEAEHPRLLAEVDRLIAQAQDCRESLRDRLSLEVRFDELCRELHAHEAAENEILRRGFGADLEGKDSDLTTLTGDV